MIELGIEVFIREKKFKQLQNRRAAFLGHNASVNKNLQNSLNLIQQYTNLTITCAIGPQHGFQGMEQANMITTEDMAIPVNSATKNTFTTEKKTNSSKTVNTLPIFSLYSKKNRRLSTDMLSQFDVLLVDLQDVGCRVYTYLTTLLYILEDCEKHQKEVWVLDRPNPAGRTIEGSILNKNYSSFVGAAAVPIRHGMTLGELALWYYSIKKLTLPLTVIQMNNYQPTKQPWPKELTWALPSPNMTDEECARCYSGTVLLEGTKVSEARGTTFPLKAFGFPGMQTETILKLMQKTAPQWLKGCTLRSEFFKPVFDKFQNQNCSAIRIYADKTFYDEKTFRPYRLVSLFLKCLKNIHPDFELFNPPPYEYEYEKMPLDILSGDNFLRQWIADKQSSVNDLEQKLSTDEKQWLNERKKFLLY